MSAAAAQIGLSRWLCFMLDDRRFALALDAVIRVVRAAEVTPLPLAPAAVIGALDVSGHILPVYDLRRRLGLPEHRLGLDDQFVIARTARRSVALVVDRTLGLIDAQPVDSQATLSLTPLQFRGVLSLPDGLALIENLEDFLTAEDDEALESALRAAREKCNPTP